MNDPWKVSEGTYPAEGSMSEQLRFLVNYAVLAPSSHNSQPWQFRIANEQLELRADRRRQLHVADPYGRELVISCGAALFFLRLAMRRFGRKDVCELFPNGLQDDLLAVLSAGEAYECTEAEKEQFEAITKRRTNRLAYKEPEPSLTLVAQLVTLASSHGAALRIVRATERSSVIDLVAEGDSIQLSDGAFRSELADWLRPNSTSLHDGMPGYALGVPAIASHLTPLLVRRMNLAKRQAASDRSAMQSPVALAVLATKNDTPRDWLSAGESLAALLLSARSDDVWASFFNQPIQVPALRERLRQYLHMDGWPQILFRFGHATDVRPTPRRGVDDVLSEGSLVLQAVSD